MAGKHNLSIKRQAVLDALCASHEHPSAEMLYDALKAEYPSLSLGTVYRNLSVFVEEGLAVPVANVEGHIRFDGCTASHAHMVCRCCGRVADVPVALDGAALCKEAEGLLGSEVDGCMLTFTGLCSECRDKCSY